MPPLRGSEKMKGYALNYKDVVPTGLKRKIERHSSL